MNTEPMTLAAATERLLPCLPNAVSTRLQQTTGTMTAISHAHESTRLAAWANKGIAA